MTFMNIRSNGRLNWKTMSRPAEHTRSSILKAAVHLFAEEGFQSTSVRDIIVNARVNQAAIKSKARTDCISRSSKLRSRSCRNMRDLSRRS
jgi:hypothetical protein